MRAYLAHDMTIPPEINEAKRWRMVEAYLEDVNASRSKIADKAHVSFALVARWLPVYKRTGGVFDDTKPVEKTVPK